MYDISLTMPAIRTPNWLDFYKSATKACKKYKFQLVIVSPFELPLELKGYSNIKLIKDFGNPTRATQIANINADGDFLYNCVDDGIFFEDCIDVALDYFKNAKLTDLDVINMRYREFAGRSGGSLPIEFWDSRFHQELRLPGIKQDWKIAMHFLMKKSLYIKLGGLDCRFEYSNHAIHDLIFRVQELGGKVYNSPIEGLNCNHFMGRSGDHAPIHDAQTHHDEPIFKNLYTNYNCAKDRTYIDIDNWKSCPEVWERRFSKKIDSYKDILEG